MKLESFGGVDRRSAVARLIVVYMLCSRSIRPSRRWWCGSASGARRERAGPDMQSAVHRQRDRDRQAHPRSQKAVAGGQLRPTEKRLVVDAFARYRIHDPLQFYQTLGSTRRRYPARHPAQFGAAARARRGDLHRRGARRARRADGAHARSDRSRGEAYGIQVVDARIRRADLPEQNSQAVYQRMQTERQREAAEYRAQGSQRPGDPRQGRPRSDRAGGGAQLQVRADPRRRATPRATGSSPKPTTRTRISSPSTARCRPTRRACKNSDTRLVLRPDAISSAISMIPRARPAPTAIAGRRAPTPPADRGAAEAAGALAIKRGMGGRCSDFLAALGLVFVIEGLVFAAFPAAPSARWRRC